jgi:FkbM family methyltransferase
MSFKTYFRTLAPASVWQTLGFCKRLLMYWRIDRSESLRVRNRVEGLPLFITDEVCVFPPENLTAYICWKTHGFEDAASSVEAREFLELATNCSALVDIGAQTGFMSALFARSRNGVFRIGSLEPDPQVLPILHRARELNGAKNGDWRILPIAVSHRSGKMNIQSSNWMYEARRDPLALVHAIDARTMTLRDVLRELAWTPDILKIDVESFEYEILCSSFDFLNAQKPALQLEVHWELLASRGRSADDFLSPLAEIGYRGMRKKYRNFAAWKRAGRSETVSRLSLRVE